MAVANLLTLLDDIASILKDVSTMTQVAAKKTAGVLGDDLALNAKQVSGVNADRELPVVWAVAKGSALNKCILVPLALLISIYLPAWVTTALLMLGGAFLCFEGAEKLLRKLLHSAEDDKQHHQQVLAANQDQSIDLVQFEKDKIKGAIRTDFILSAEIIVISLGTLASASVVNKVAVLVAVSVLMTVGVYGFVAGIVKIDDLGLYLLRSSSAFMVKIGRMLLVFAPWLMKFLTVAGTIAMFLVGGGIIVHGLPFLHHLVEGVVKFTESAVGSLGGFTASAMPVLADGIAGVVVGALLVLVITGFSKLKTATTQ
jgi:uncharacterized protein